MKVISILLATLAVSSALRMKREVCQGEMTSFVTCINTAVDALSRAIQKDDGRKDLVERKICNLLEDILKCDAMVTGTCHTQDLKSMMKISFNKMLDVGSTMPGWNTEKCPAAVSFLNGVEISTNIETKEWETSLIPSSSKMKLSVLEVISALELLCALESFTLMVVMFAL